MLHTSGIVVFLHPSSFLGLVNYWFFCFLVFFLSSGPVSLELLIFFPFQPVSLFTLQRNAYFFFWVASCYLVSSLCEIWKHSSNVCHLIKKMCGLLVKIICKKPLMTNHLCQRKLGTRGQIRWKLYNFRQILNIFCFIAILFFILWI